MATVKTLQTLFFVLLVSASLAAPVEEALKTVEVEHKSEVAVEHDAPKTVETVVVETPEQPQVREEPVPEAHVVQDPHVVLDPHVVQDNPDIAPQDLPRAPNPVEPSIELHVGGGPAPDDLAASPDAHPAAEEGTADLETANTFGLGYYGYRPWGYSGWRRGYGYGRGYGGYGGWGGYGYGYPSYGHGWGHGYWG